MLSLFLEEVQSWYRESLGEPQGEGGSVSVWQLAGSALNLNPHIHALVLDGLYVWDPVQERPVFRYASRPGRKAMAGLVKRIRLRVLSLLEAEGLLGEDVVAPDDDTAQMELVEAGMTPSAREGARSRAPTGRSVAWALPRVGGLLRLARERANRSSGQSRPGAGVALHPTQLYEVGFNLLIFVVVNWFYRRKHFDGQVMLLYLVLYAIIRSINEVFRGDVERGFFLEGLLKQTVSTSQALSVVVIAGGVAVFWWGARRWGSVGAEE